MNWQTETHTLKMTYWAAAFPAKNCFLSIIRRIEKCFLNSFNFSKELNAAIWWFFNLEVWFLYPKEQRMIATVKLRWTVREMQDSGNLTLRWKQDGGALKWDYWQSKQLHLSLCFIGLNATTAFKKLPWYLFWCVARVTDEW